MLKLVQSLSRTQKQYVLITVDSLLIPVALFFALSLQISPIGARVVMSEFLEILPYLILLAAAVSVSMGASAIQLKTYEATAIGQSAVYAFLVAGISTSLTIVAKVPVAISTQIVFGISLFVFTVLSRIVLLQIVSAIYRSAPNRMRVLIYGAGSTGMQLVSALRNHDQIDPVAFVDDNAALHGMTVARLPVFTPARVPEIAVSKKIDRVLLAVPSLSYPKQAQIARRLQKMGLEVQALPSFSQLIGEEELVEKLTPLNPNVFLGRAEVAEDFDAQSNAYIDKTVLISGAGGSIGSELCRQVIRSRPKKLVLFELSELALYNINTEILQAAEGGEISVVPILGSVTDAQQVRKVLADHDVDVILHAAAYKHVPLVESNPLAGMANNVLGTHILAAEGSAANVERFILISSDKAVRPTNIMGASKRLAELVIQDLASRVPTAETPKYSIVRFGNVLGSSGSVIPLFQDQLRRGGPLTVTHPNVRRYFMTVQEAVNLVLQAGAMAKGGEVFVLDMGKPINIDQLARQLIESSGYTVRDAGNPDGDIAIEYTGLRPGEKMAEELTLSGALIGSGHRKIFFANEAKLSEIEVASALSKLRQALASGDEEAARQVAMRWVEGFGGSTMPENGPMTEEAAPVT
ncbi:MAG: nucleoside-diphosphate sugar epimerase/dehydratase [Pseudomonadota bacterium]